MYDPNALSYAMEQLQLRRQKDLRLEDEHKAEVLNKVPCYSALLLEEAEYRANRRRAHFTGDKKAEQEADEKITAVRKDIDTALQEKGLSVSYLSVFTCKRCKDTGHLEDGSLCGCVKTFMREYQRNEISKRFPIGRSSFESFSMDSYSNIKDERIGRSPQEIFNYIVSKCRKYASSLPKSGNLLLMGESGLGKTHLALAVANEALSADLYVKYVSSGHIFNIITGELNDFSRQSNTLDSLKECDLLILDDLGTETVNPVFLNAMYELLDYRINFSKPTIITTNLTSPQTIASRYTDKLASRLLGSFEPLYFTGKDYRLKAGNLDYSAK